MSESRFLQLCSAVLLAELRINQLLSATRVISFKIGKSGDSPETRSAAYSSEGYTHFFVVLESTDEQLISDLEQCLIVRYSLRDPERCENSQIGGGASPDRGGYVYLAIKAITDKNLEDLVNRLLFQ
jgi:hypothetical protein